MLTPILSGKDHAIRRFRAVDELPKDKTAFFKAVHFIKAHKETAKQFASMEDMLDGRGKEVTRSIPDQMCAGGMFYPVSRGLVQARKDGYSMVMIPEEYAVELDALDRQMDELRKKLQDTLEEAFRRGRAVRVNDLVAATAQEPGGAC